MDVHAPVAIGFDAVLDAAPDAMLLADDAGTIVAVNREALRVFDYTREELIGAPIETLVPERFRGRHPAHRAAYAGDPRTRPMGAGLDLWASRRDGSEFPAEISLSRARHGDTSYTIAAVRDVTDRRRNEAKFRGLLEAAPDAIVIVDTTGKIVIVNAQAERMFGYARAELIGSSVDMLVPVRIRAEHPKHRDHFVANARARAMGSDIELHAVRRDGTEFPVEISLSPLETEEGTLISSAIRDVSLRKRTERELRHAYAELEAFSYSIAHDLRAPLRGMNGFAQVLLEDYAERLDADGLDALNEIRTNATRMSELIDALLSLSRLSRRAMEPAEIDLAGYARTALARLATADASRAVEVVAPANLYAWADPALARTIVENLVGNAWKFTLRTKDARIEVGVEDQDHERVFFVRDNGAGFDMAYAAKLFAPFQRLHRSGDYPGTGIGLATAQRIVHRHGGRIWATGEVDRGATIYFTFPNKET
jgi:PAS domain S-box-containing protein